MTTVTTGTMRRIARALPTLGWGEDDLAELVAPRHGVITGFADLMRDLEALERQDLGETAPAGPLQPPGRP